MKYKVTVAMPCAWTITENELLPGGVPCEQRHEVWTDVEAATPQDAWLAMAHLRIDPAQVLSVEEWSDDDAA